MKIIGITGGIGTGKSLVLSILKTKYDAYIVEADKVAHILMKKGEPAYIEIVNAFGTSVLDKETGELDRASLGSLVMNDKEKLNVLNSIVHPLVKDYILSDIEKKRKEDITYYVIEAALLIQDGYKQICDEIWAIITDKDIRIERLKKNRNYTIEKADGFIKNQPSDDFFIDNSDRIIYNNTDEGDLIKAIDEILDL